MVRSLSRSTDFAGFARPPRGPRARLVARTVSSHSSPRACDWLRIVDDALFVVVVVVVDVVVDVVVIVEAVVVVVEVIVVDIAPLHGAPVGSRSASCTAQAKASSLSKLGRCRLFFLLFVAPRAQMVVYWCARVSRGESEQSSSSSVLVVRVRRSWRKELPPREGVIDGSRGVLCAEGDLSLVVVVVVRTVVG